MSGQSTLTIDTEVEFLWLFPCSIDDTTLVAGLVTETGTFYPKNLTPVGDLQIGIAKKHQPREILEEKEESRAEKQFTAGLVHLPLSFHFVTALRSVNAPMLEGTYFLSLYHWIVGKGTPFTLHSRVISCLRIAETSWGELDPVMVGGTGTRSIIVCYSSRNWNWIVSLLFRVATDQSLTALTHLIHPGRNPFQCCLRCWWLCSCSYLHLPCLPSVASMFSPYQGSGCCYYLQPVNQHKWMKSKAYTHS